MNTKKIKVNKGDHVLLSRGGSIIKGQALHNKTKRERRLEIVMDEVGNTNALDTSYWQVHITKRNMIPYD